MYNEIERVKQTYWEKFSTEIEHDMIKEGIEYAKKKNKEDQ